MHHQAPPDDRARPGHDIEHALGEDLGRKLRQAQSREWRRAGWLEHDRTAGGQCRSDLPDRHHDRVVPGGDLAHHPDRLPADHAGVGAHVFARRLPLHHARRAGEEADVVDRELEVEVGDTLWLADIGALQARELCGVVADHIGELVQRG